MTKSKQISDLNTSPIEGSFPTVCIIGGGFSGLLTAINLKGGSRPLNVVVLDKPKRESNTQISGMRIRDVAHLQEPLTPVMREFALLLDQELTRWNKMLGEINPGFVNKSTDWFGPQWGILNKNGVGGRGLSVIKILQELAKDRGVVFLNGEAQGLITANRRLEAVAISGNGKNYLFNPDTVILANGNAAGSLFESTNKPIKYSATELLFKAGLPMDGSTIMMWHPFGNCNSKGEPLFGCYETDLLADSRVYLKNGKEDHETTRLLREHEAHYHFREIAQRFLEQGGMVKLVNTAGEERTARVALHYTHLGAQTTDGVKVKGIANLAVVGDAGGLSYFTDYQPRQPGLALSHAIVSARKASEWILQTEFPAKEETHINENGLTDQSGTVDCNELRATNTKHVLELEFGQGDNKQQLELWTKELQKYPDNRLAALSLALVDSWTKKIAGEQEPIPIGLESGGFGNLEAANNNNDYRPLKRRL